MKSLILITCLLQTIFAAPQLITFKDGKVGVNFLGYHAEAGLGGGQDGQGGGLLGGLHASAGTPWGQNAAAGLGGNVNGRAAGVLYAGAQATPDVGASAVLCGDTSRGGYSGTDAYANGKVTSHTRTIVAGNTQKRHEAAEPQLPPQPVTENVNAIQKIRPPKKYYSSETYDFVNNDNNSFNNGVAFNTNKAKNLYHIEQDKSVATETAVAPSSIVITKTINKTKFITAAPVKSLNINDNNNNNNNQHQHYHLLSNEFNTTPSSSSLSSLSSSSLSGFSYDSSVLTPPTTDIIHSSVLLQHSSLSADNSKDAKAQGAVSTLNNKDTDNNDDNNNNSRTVIITKDRTKLRTRQHPRKHRRNHQEHNLNRQRQRTKTIVKIIEQQPSAEQQQQQHNYRHTEELIPIETKHQQLKQISQQQQHPVRRQLIAPPPAPHDVPAPPCDTMREQCNNVPHREVRSDAVQNALQIPIGILQSLQQSLGNFRHSH